MKLIDKNRKHYQMELGKSGQGQDLTAYTGLGGTKRKGKLSEGPLDGEGEKNCK